MGIFKEHTTIRRQVFSAALFIAVLCGSFYAPGKTCAGTVGGLSVEAEAEYGFSTYERNPDPIAANVGSAVSQAYRLYLNGGMMRHGFIDSSFGLTHGDIYRERDVDLENRVRFDYGRWLQMETVSEHHTDEDIFFSGTAEPQSPIHTVRRKYLTRFRPNKTTTMEYNFQGTEREDLVLGTVTDELTRQHAFKMDMRAGAVDLGAEYRTGDFKDRLGQRSDVENDDLNLEMFYKPNDYLAVSGFLEDGTDKNVDDGTELRSKDSTLEISIRPSRAVRFRERIKMAEDINTQTNEDILNKSNEMILNVAPAAPVDLEFAYKRADENKQRELTDIDSTINEGRFNIAIKPVKKVNIQGGYSISDKTSTSDTENLRGTKAYSDVSVDLTKSLRLNGNLSVSGQKNTRTSLTESETTALSGGLQYKPTRTFSLFMRMDTTQTDNPSTGAYTDNDTISASVNMDPYDFLDISLRSSGQETTGSSESSDSTRTLNSAEFRIRPLKGLEISVEGEIINSDGASSSDEELTDISLAYTLGKIDFSTRLQNKNATGNDPNEKTSVSNSLKYRITNDTVLSFKFLSIAYKDPETPSDDYDSRLFEILLSMRF